MKIYNQQNIFYKNNVAFSAEHRKEVDVFKIAKNDDVFVKTQNILDVALAELEKLKFDKSDIQKIKRYGANIIFKDGAEAVKHAKENNINIKFDNIDNSDTHAQWENSTNSIIINNRYKNTKNLAEIYAISAAILHELSHSKDNDSFSSIQEEINCLGMNVLAFSAFDRKYPELFKNSNSPIIDNGVKLYADLFLGDDKEALKKRIYEKYGNLLLASSNHPASEFAIEILEAKFSK